jgi:2-polyprenyl-3-methyl-5-hydroxy-6-metoxy-1,4-benzoquinol methylase
MPNKSVFHKGQYDNFTSWVSAPDFQQAHATKENVARLGETIKPEPRTASNVHETVLRLLEYESRGRMLDAGTGEGALALRMIEMGFNVEACDLNTEMFKLQTIASKKVDLNKALPYPDNSFDFCVCVETIEHLHDAWHIISELNRVLKRNGKLIVTTPNIHSILSRLRFLFYGEHSFFTYKEFAEKPIDTYHGLDKHINPVSFPELEHILSENKMELEEVATNMYVHQELSMKGLLAALTYPIIKTFMVVHFGRKTFLTRDELICGQILILKARKL